MTPHATTQKRLEQKRAKVKAEYQGYKSPNKPTSFRELSESREKKKLLSNKKSLACREGHLRTPESSKNSAKMEGNLFAKLLSPKSSAHPHITRPFEETNQCWNDSALSFSAFKGVCLKNEEDSLPINSKIDNKENMGEAGSLLTNHYQ